MNSFTKAVEIVAKSFKTELVAEGYEWDSVCNWNHMLYLLNADLDSLRNGVRFSLGWAAHIGEIGSYPMDDESIDNVIWGARVALFG
jgi:hypothetical protein